MLTEKGKEIRDRLQASCDHAKAEEVRRRAEEAEEKVVKRAKEAIELIEKQLGSIVDPKKSIALLYTTQPSLSHEDRYVIEEMGKMLGVPDFESLYSVQDFTGYADFACVAAPEDLLAAFNASAQAPGDASSDVASKAEG